MEKTNILTLIITLVVGVILTGALLVPVINDAVDGRQENFSNGTDYAQYITGDHVITISGSDVTLDSETALLRGSSYSNVLAESFIVAGTGSSRSVGCASGSLNSSDADITITIASGNATITNSTTTYTADCDGFYIHTTDKTANVWAAPTDTPYISSDSDVVLGGKYSSGSIYICAEGVGYINGTSEDVTTSIVKTAVSGYDDLYTLGTVTVGTTALNLGIIVPANVEGTITGSGDNLTLLAVIPILVIVALLIMVVRGMAIGKN